MPVLLLPRRYAYKPPMGVTIIPGHPLAPDVICCLFNEQAGFIAHNLANRARPGQLAGAANAKYVNGPGGPTCQFSAAAGNYVKFFQDDFIPTTACTVVIKFRKTDATNRDSGLFGMTSVSDPPRCGAHCPWSDGTVYWDFAGQTSGTTRLSVAGLSFTYPSVMVFTAGPLGQQIWQNGVSKASHTNSVGTRSIATADYGIGTHENFSSDSVEIEFFYMYSRALRPTECQQISTQPFSFLEAPSATYFLAAGAAVPPKRLPTLGVG